MARPSNASPAAAPIAIPTYSPTSAFDVLELAVFVPAVLEPASPVLPLPVELELPVLPVPP